MVRNNALVVMAQFNAGLHRAAREFRVGVEVACYQTLPHLSAVAKKGMNSGTTGICMQVNVRISTIKPSFSMDADALVKDEMAPGLQRPAADADGPCSTVISKSSRKTVEVLMLVQALRSFPHQIRFHYVLRCEVKV